MKKIPFEDTTNFTTNDIITRNALINTVDDVKNFINDCLTILNINFHPDSPFEDYVKYSDNTPMFTPEESSALNDINDICFEICEKFNEDYYDLCFNIFNELNGNIFGSENKDLEPEPETITTECLTLNIDYNKFKKGDTFIKKGNNYVNENGEILKLPVNEILNIFTTSQNNSSIDSKPNRMISAQRGDHGNFNWVNYQKNFNGNSIGITTKNDIDNSIDTNIDNTVDVALEVGESYKILNTDNNILRVKYLGVSESNKNEFLFKHSLIKEAIVINKQNIKQSIIK